MPSQKKFVCDKFDKIESKNIYKQSLKKQFDNKNETLEQKKKGKIK